MKYSSINESFYRHARRPVQSLPILYDWRLKYEPVFDQQIIEIRNDLRMARTQNKFICYLSCPISRRGGGSRSTNVAISEYVTREIESEWGQKMWVLNPAEFQMETDIGKERLHLSALKNQLEHIYQKMKTDEGKPSGSDYMRMWSKILTENEDGEFTYGSMFDMYVFVGSEDVQDFFRAESGGDNHTANVEDYLARKISTTPSFHNYFIEEPEDDDERKRRAGLFIRFYSVRSSANYSKGCHDEWNTWVLTNRKKLMDGNAVRHQDNPEFQIGSQIPGYMNGHQIGPAESETVISGGYGILVETIASMEQEVLGR